MTVEHKFLGVHSDGRLNCKNNTHNITNKVHTHRYSLKILVDNVSFETRKIVYYAYNRINTKVWYNWRNSTDFNRVVIVQKSFLRTVCTAPFRSSRHSLFKITRLLTLP